MRLRVTIGAIWLAAIVATIVTAFATRSSFAEVNPFGGVFIVVGCAIGIGVAVVLIRSPIVLAVTAVAGAFFASQVAWTVLHDESSTAALGVIVPPFVNGIAALVGAGLGAVVERRRHSFPRP